MKRRFSNILAILSLLLLAATTSLWVWSYFDWIHAGNHVMMSVSGGQYRVDWEIVQPFYPRDWWVSVPSVKKDFIGFGYYHGIPSWGATGPKSPEIYRIVWPCWSVALLLTPFAVWGARWLLRERRQIRMARIGLCPHCGYDLRASPNRCPECGTPVAQAITAHP